MIFLTGKMATGHPTSIKRGLYWSCNNQIEIAILHRNVESKSLYDESQIVNFIHQTSYQSIFKRHIEESQVPIQKILFYFGDSPDNFYESSEILDLFNAMICRDRYFPGIEVENFTFIVGLCIELNCYFLISDILVEYLTADEDLMLKFIVFILNKFNDQYHPSTAEIIHAICHVHIKPYQLIRNAISNIIESKKISVENIRRIGRRLGIQSYSDEFEMDRFYVTDTLN